MSAEGVIRAVARCALGLAPADPMLDWLDAERLPGVMNEVDERALPATIHQALLQLHPELRADSEARAAARRAFDAIRRDGEASWLCPVEAVLAGLEDSARTSCCEHADAQRIAALPWHLLDALLPRGLARTCHDFCILLDASLHEVTEGNVDPSADNRELARRAAALASELRLRFDDAYPS